MTREEILARSRSEHRDEGMEYAENLGRKIGFSAFCCVFLILILFQFFTGGEVEGFLALFWAFLAAEALPNYQFTRKKSYLITAICGALASLLFLVDFMLDALR